MKHSLKALRSKLSRKRQTIINKNAGQKTKKNKGVLFRLQGVEKVSGQIELTIFQL